MTAVLAFLGAHWKGLFIGAGGVVLGAYLGRVTAPKPINPPPCPSCPELHCAAAVDAGVQSQADCKAKVVVRYVTTDAGCPEPVVSVDTSGSTSSSSNTTGNSTASATPPPVVVTRTVVAPGPVWELGGGVGVSMEGRLAIPAGVRWYPGGGTLGLGVEGDLRPKVFKQSSIGLSVAGRW